MNTQIVDANTWLYPDSSVESDAPQRITLSSARGARAACQILCTSVREGAEIRVDFQSASSDSWLAPEVSLLVDVAVGKNTGDFGFVVKDGESAAEYTTREAPFRVYDAMRPLGDGAKTRSTTQALYVTWYTPHDAFPGGYTGTLKLVVGEESQKIPVELEVFPAIVPEKGGLAVTNWFSVGNMATHHDLEPWSPKHWEMIERYGQVMRRGRQSNFLIPIGVVGIEKTGPGNWELDFDRVERLAELFFGMGFTTLESGHLGTRRRFNDSTFVLTGDSSIQATSPDGYSFLSQYFKQWRELLEKRGWLDRVIQYVGDEPTMHSAADYRILAGMIRKLLPGVPLADAVELPELGGALDIWVPKNSYYQQHRDAFDRHREKGDTIWCYTCCIPGGRFMNRFLDTALIRTRLIHWGNFLFDLPGFLHWGLNQYRPGQDPFENTTPVHGDDGETFLPSGDTHIVYPGDDGPWSSVRLEAMGMGVEDYELLRQVESSDSDLAHQIATKSVRSFDDYDEDAESLARCRLELLKAASSAA